MPRLSLGLGVQAVSKVKAGAAPSGIPVSTINLIIIQDGVTSGPYTKISSLLWSFNPNFGADPYLQYDGVAYPNAWSLYASDGEGGYNVYNHNLAGSSTIPTSGWISPITITAA
jgi:hypothetical protein